MTLNGVMAAILRYFTKFGSMAILSEFIEKQCVKQR